MDDLKGWSKRVVRNFIIKPKITYYNIFFYLKQWKWFKGWFKNKQLIEDFKNSNKDGLEFFFIKKSFFFIYKILQYYLWIVMYCFIYFYYYVVKAFYNTSIFGSRNAKKATQTIKNLQNCKNSSRIAKTPARLQKFQQEAFVRTFIF